MKTIYTTLLFLFSVTLFAQSKPIDLMNKTELRTFEINDGDETIEKTMLLITTKTQKFETKPDPKHYENMVHIKTPIKVKKTVAIDDNGDNKYESSTTFSYYVSENYESIEEIDLAKTTIQANSNIKAKLTPDMKFVVTFDDPDTGKSVKQIFDENLF